MDDNSYNQLEQYFQSILRLSEKYLGSQQEFSNGILLFSCYTLIQRKKFQEARAALAKVMQMSRRHAVEIQIGYDLLMGQIELLTGNAELAWKHFQACQRHFVDVFGDNTSGKKINEKKKNRV
jgi:hypothetical protein